MHDNAKSHCDKKIRFEQRLNNINAFTLQMAIRTQQMVKEIPQDVVLSLLSPSLYIYIYECMRVRTKQQSVLTKYSKGFHRSTTYPLSSISGPAFGTENGQPGLGAREGIRKHVSAQGFATNLWYVSGQALLCSFFFPSHSLFIFVLRSSGRRLFLSLTVKPYNSLYHVDAFQSSFCFTESITETAHSIVLHAFHGIEYKALHEMGICLMEGKIGAKDKP